MDDLTGLDWSTSSNNPAKKAPVTGTGNYYTSIQPTPALAISGRSTPLSAQASGSFKPSVAGIPKPSTPDSFSNLVSFGSAKQGNKLTLQEQQEKLEAEKAKRTAEQRKQYESQFGHSQFWDKLSAKPRTLSSTPVATSRSSSPHLNSIPFKDGGFSGTINGRNTSRNDDDGDLFTAFNADTKVDNSSYYPPPNTPLSIISSPANNKVLDLSKPEAWGYPLGRETTVKSGDDDDPFGLGRIETAKTAPSHSFIASEEDDDFLGDLGKPVEDVKRHVITSSPVKQPKVTEEPQYNPDDPWDKAINELVDMGFSAENSRRALTESGAGLDIQTAVGWLLNDAHRQAKEKAQSKRGPAKDPERDNGSDSNGRNASGDRSGNEAIPAWMRREGRSQSQPRRDDSRSPANSDSDISKTAAAVGSNLLKTANSLWKTSQKKVQKAVSDLSHESDLSQPKWMRDVLIEREQPEEKQNFSEAVRRGREGNSTPEVTDEALMLEADLRPPLRSTKGPAESRFFASGSSSSRDQSPAVSNPSTGRSTPVPRWQQVTPNPSLDPRARLNKQAVEEQSAKAYVSPARRKNAAPLPKAEDTSDLLFSKSSAGSSQPSVTLDTPRTQKAASSEVRKPSKPSISMTVRPKAPTRNIPSLTSAALATSTQHRQAGTAHFKRGDYASAHASYTSSLSSIPKGHPITIVLLSNRSLTALKTGDPKGAVSDADTALNVIGLSRGENESIDLGDGTPEGKKPMKEYWAKALMRKAEALEQMERWKDAGTVWREAVEAGVGGVIAVQGRQRCEKALMPKSKPSVAQQPQKASPKLKTALNNLAPAPVQNTAAINRLRAANLAAEKADDEKFALGDSVDARVSKWRDGRKDNLRALLGGLDQVLWEGSGWKKVGMHELVINSKVKIVYMKAIARVHPDKVGSKFSYITSRSTMVCHFWLCQVGHRRQNSRLIHAEQIPQEASTEVKMISASVFATLNEAWDKFKTENGM